jgi:hypothetical protein
MPIHRPFVTAILGEFPQQDMETADIDRTRICIRTGQTLI